MNVISLLKRVTRKFPGKTAVIENDRYITYSDLWDRINFVSRFYRELGRIYGDRILIVLPNSANFLFYHLAALKIGAISVPVKTDYKLHEIKKIFFNCQPSLLISNDLFLNKNGPLVSWIKSKIKCISVDDIKPGTGKTDIGIWPCGNNDIASINYTYFEGGYPRGAALTHGNHIYSANGVTKHLGFYSSDRYLAILPMAHVFTLTAIIKTSIINGGTIVIAESFSPRAILSTLEKYKISIMVAVPAIYEFVARHKQREKYDLSSLRRCITGGDYMPGELQAEFEKKLGTQILQGYGLTECLPIFCNPPGERNKHGTLGLNGRRDIMAKIVDLGNGKDLGVDQVGEILIKSPTTMPGYYNLPDDTEKILKDGWLYTGDLGKMDKEGFLHFTGLKKEVLNIYGNKVDPLEIEEVILRHPYVGKVEICLETIPKRNSIIGNKKICAVVYIKENKQIDKIEIADFCKKEIADYKIPKKIELHEM